MREKDFRIRIFQPIVPEYRVPLFEELAGRYGDRIEVWASPKQGSDASCPMKGVRYDYAHPMRRLGPLVWQSGFSLRWLQRGDVAVVCGDVHQLSSLYVALAAKCKGIKVVWWGHHKSASSRRLGVVIRLMIARCLSDAFLCYTDEGVRYLRQHGFVNMPVVATGNTIDLRTISVARKKWSNEALFEFENRNGLRNQNLILVCGVLRQKMKLELLMEAFASSKFLRKSVIVVVIGDGPEKEQYIQSAKRLGVFDKFVWVEGSRDQNKLAPWFLSAKMFVYPGAIGLAIMHAFAYGLPVVTHGNASHQMPEFEAMESGETGLTYAENDAVDLATKIEMLLNDENKRRAMCDKVRKVVESKYPMDAMVENFCAVIDAVRA